MSSLALIVTKPENLRVAIAGDITHLQEPRSTWTKEFKSLPVRPPLLSPPCLEAALLTLTLASISLNSKYR